MHRALIINSVVCLLGVILGAFFALMSVISIANMHGWAADALIIAALLIPVMFFISGFGLWMVNHRQFNATAVGLILLPWVYGSLFVIAMLVSLRA